ncbi:DNA-binding CsgD family transcriptional regulator [Methylobacterium sp. BE186]|uniref:helix-turn-helix domain-containing protein n=1 Tax=Methylobacterium sp. BE186 TaxID=2817715 RepID=UPI00285A4739|nr:helix-turn-helix domain-containing protein [Methylobacterium sp. BE186]MDR7037373.1 DNA-binding CsgD family transcriptional regulator [Methylobacterium sp. BE186]
MSGYIPFLTSRPSFAHVRPATPIVNRELVTAKPKGKRPAQPWDRAPDGSMLASQVKEMRRLRAKGISQRELARKFRCGLCTVHDHVHDIPPPRGGWLRGGKATRLPKEQILQWRREGWTYKCISDELKCSQNAVYSLVNGRPRYRDDFRGDVSKLTARVCRVVGLMPLEIRAEEQSQGGRSEWDLARARHILFWLARRETGLSFEKIGKRLGGFDHSTVRHGYVRVGRVIAALGLEEVADPREMTARLWSADWPKVGR